MTHRASSEKKIHYFWQLFFTHTTRNDFTLFNDGFCTCFLKKEKNFKQKTEDRKQTKSFHQTRQEKNNDVLKVSILDTLRF